MLNNVRINAERKTVVLDYLDYVKQKAKGDEVDKLIAKQLEIEEIAA